jgi:cytochrome c-type biogenesis protein CcmH
MNQMAYFWAIAGFMAGIAAAFFVTRLWRPMLELPGLQSVRAKVVAGGATLLFVVVVFGIYGRIGKPELGSRTAGGGIHISAIPDGINQGSANGAGSMAEATSKLSSRLATSSGSDSDWQLLQQSYEFIGDSEAAELAKQHKLKPAQTTISADPTAAVSSSTMGTESTAAVADDQATLVVYQQAVARNPKDAGAWLTIAQLQRSVRNFAAADAAYQHVMALKAMNADAWADYADASASLSGSLSNGKTRSAINAALKLQPQHSKALWLQASLALEEHRYTDALKLWQVLRASLPSNSPDAGVIDANIEEARSLAGTDAGVAALNKQDSSVAAISTGGAASQVRGSIVVDPALKQRVSAGMTLFVYAKAVDSPAPVAAYRTSVESWPANFVLDDTLAMMPTRKLSQFDKVTVQARLSRGGQALPQSGDLQSDPVVVATNSRTPVSLHISSLVP